MKFADARLPFPPKREGIPIGGTRGRASSYLSSIVSAKTASYSSQNIH